MPAWATAGDGQRAHAVAHLLRSRSGAARALRVLLVILGVLLGLASLRLPLQSLQPEQARGKDLVQEYVLSRALLDRADPYREYFALLERYVGHNPNPAYPYATAHPPTAGIMFLPLAFLDYVTASRVWFGIELACLVLSVALIARAMGRRLSVPATLAVSAAALAWYPFAVDLYFGQLTLAQLALLSGAWLALRSERPIVGGTLLGIAILLKQFLWPLALLFLLRRMWRPFVASGATVVAGYAVAIWAIGLKSVIAYFRDVLPAVSDGYKAVVGNMSLSTLGWRLFDGTGSATIPGDAAPPVVAWPAAAELVSAAVPLLALFVAALVARRQRSFDASFGLMICASIVASPISWSHYLILAAIPTAQVIDWLARHRFPRLETNAALLVALLLFLPFAGWLLLGGAVAGSILGTSAPSSLALPLALLTLAPAWSVCLLGWLVAALLPVESERTERLVHAARDIGVVVRPA